MTGGAAGSNHRGGALRSWRIPSRSTQTDSKPAARHLVAVMVLAFAAVRLAPIGGADPAMPSPSTDDGASCSFTLAAPQATEVPGGTSGVTATLTPGTCTGQPVTSVVCIASPSGRSDCGKSYAFDQAQVTMVASPLKGRFTATGKGCWHRPGHGADYECATSGPVVTTF